MSFFKRHQKTVIWLLVIGFVASIAVGGGVGWYLRSRSSPPRGSPEEVVLNVEGRKVTRQEFEEAYRNLRTYYTQLYAMYNLDFEALLQGTEGAFRALPYRAQAAEEIIRSVLLEAAARELRVTVSRAEADKAVAAQYQAILAQYGLTEAQLAEILRAQGKTLDAYKKELAQVQQAQLREEQVRKLAVGPVEPTEADLLAYYEANHNRYQTEAERIRVAHILVQEARLADELLGELAAPGADFASLAQAHSLDTATRDQGGETDWFTFAESPFSTKVTEAVWEADVGQVKLVDDEQGFHLVQVLDRQPAVVPPLAEVRDTVRRDYVQEKEAERWDGWYSARRARSEVKVLDPVLAAAMAHGTDKTRALAELEAARAEQTSEDPYLNYYIGRLHEELLAAVTARRVELEGKTDRSPDEEAELSRLRTEETRYKDQAVAAYLAFIETGEGDDAFFRRLLSLAPENAEVHFAWAEMYRQAGNWLAAEGEYRKAIEFQPTLVAAYIGRGDVLMTLEIYSQAAEAYRQALDLQPGNVSLTLRLAGAYVKDNQLSLAEPLLGGVLVKEPNNATALTLMGDLLLARGDTAGAIARYDAAYRRSLTADTLLKLAGAHLAAGGLAEAKKWYEDATKIFPYRAEGHLGLGEVYLKLGEPDRALAALRQALSRATVVSLKETIARRIVDLAPDDLRTRLLLAGYFREQYKYDGAIVQYEEILTRTTATPERIQALDGLGDCYRAKVQYDQAQDYYRQALDLMTTPGQKIPAYTKVIEVEESRAGAGGTLGPLGLEALWQRAQAYAAIGEAQKAVDDLERIGDVDPEFRKEEVAGLLGQLTLPQPR